MNMSRLDKIRNGIRKLYTHIYYLTSDGLVYIPKLDYVIDLKGIETPFVSKRKNAGEIREMVEDIPDGMEKKLYSPEFVDTLKQAYGGNEAGLKDGQIHVTSKALTRDGEYVADLVSYKNSSGKGRVLSALKLLYKRLRGGYMTPSRLDFVPLSFRLPTRNGGEPTGNRLSVKRDYETDVKDSLRVELPASIIIDLDELESIADEHSILRTEKLNDRQSVVDVIQEIEPHMLFASPFCGYHAEISVPHEVHHLNHLIRMNLLANDIADREGRSVDEVFVGLRDELYEGDEKKVGCARLIELFSGMQAANLIQNYNGSDKERLVEILSKKYDFRRVADLKKGVEMASAHFAKDTAEGRGMDVGSLFAQLPYLYKDKDLAKIEELPNGKELTAKMVEDALPASSIRAFAKKTVPNKKSSLERKISGWNKNLRIVHAGVFGGSLVAQYAGINPLLTLAAIYLTRPVLKLSYKTGKYLGG